MPSALSSTKEQLATIDLNSQDVSELPGAVVMEFETSDGSSNEESSVTKPNKTSRGGSNVPPLYSVDELNTFGQRLAKRMARNPCWHLNVCLFVSIALSAIAMIVGEFSVSAEQGGWNSRGTPIADRQTQLMLVETFKWELFSSSDTWDELIDNIQPGWEDDDDDSTDDERRRRHLIQDLKAETNSQVETFSDYLTPKADRLASLNMNSHRQVPFEMTPTMHRKLQDEPSLGDCDEGALEWYTSAADLTEWTHLWPVWQLTTSSTNTVLDPSIVQDICLAEEKTQAHLEKEGLCFGGCGEDKRSCLPPYSIVLYARLAIGESAFGMTCEELAEAWAPLQAETETQWTTCVEEIKSSYKPNEAATLPESCPYGFLPHLVEEAFDVNDGTSQYTSSIFATDWQDVDELYEQVENFNRGSNLVQGAYDTQFEDFVNLYVDSSLMSDMALAMGSAAIVAVAIIIHTRSPFISLIGILQIILSFPLSYFVYKLMAGLQFFPFLNFIGIFVVFALGAGDVFVAVDKWRNARLEFPKASTEYVAAIALPDAASAMFLTTLTTAVAFLATAICPVAPIKMFAIFCGLLIIFDYIMNVLLVFPALCIYDKALQTSQTSGRKVNSCITCTCFGFLGAKKVVAEDNDDQDQDEAAPSSQDDEDPIEKNVTINQEEEEFTFSLMHRMLLGYYNIMHSIRWPLLAVCMAMLGLTIYYASTLELPTSSDVRLLDDSSQFEQNYLWRQKLLSNALTKAGGSEANVIWGVKPADTGDQNNPAEWSQLVLDKTFEPSSEDAQVFLTDFCEKLFENEFALPVENDYTCPMTRFDWWLEEQSNSTQPDSIYTEHCNGATGVPVPQETFDACIIAWSQAAAEASILPRDDKVQVVFFPFTSRVRYDDQYDKLDDEWNMIEDWVKVQNKNAPAGVTGGYFSSFDFWWYDTNGQMLQTAYSAAAIAIGCAAAVILFSSRSIMLTIFSTLTIGYVLTSVTATLVALGWTLGFLESICFAILIGVSVDFVIHFSHAYTMLPGNADRGRRTKYALIKMGPSILATAVTTVLSAIIMLFTVITFFQKFALILFFTVIQASLGSFVVYLTLTDCIGPSNPTYLIDRLMGEKAVDELSETEPTNRMP